MTEIERQKTGAPSPMYGKEGDNLTPNELESAKDQLQKHLQTLNDKANA
jgi:hypothetical protein